jgi:DNA-binding NarL/FixJ family response regulator
MDTIKLLIADDHKIVRDGLRAIFECEDHFEIIGEVGNGRDLVAKSLELLPDVVITDLKMPLMSGMEAARMIKGQKPSIRIVILTAYDERNDVQQAIEAGVDGYMLKDTLPDELIKAVELVHKGYTCIFPSDARESPVLHQKWFQGAVEEELTEREMEVYWLIAQNFSNQEIARKLYISEATVKSHVSKILRKTGQPNRAQAVVYGLSRGIFDAMSIQRGQSDLG